MRRYKSFVIKILPLLTIILLVLLLFGKTLFPPEGKMIYGGDIYDAYYYWKNFLRESIRQGILPFWNPFNFSGMPFLAHPNINIFYPPNWLFIILPLNFSFSWYFFIHITLAGINMYWLARQFTGRAASLTSAIIYCLGGFFAARVYSGHLEYVDVASWVPLVFGLTRKAFLKSSLRNITLSGVGMGIMLLCGNELFFLFVLEILVLFAVYLLITKYRNKKFITKALSFTKVGFLSIVIGFTIAAVELLPRYQFMSLSIRSGGVSYGMAGSGSLPFSGIRLFIQPFFWGSPFRNSYSYTGPWPNLFEYTHYVGVLPIVLIGVFLAFFIIDRVSRVSQSFFSTPPSRSPFGHLEGVNSELWFFLLVIIPIFLLISFGIYVKPNLHQLLWQYTPFYKSIRFPARHLFVVYFALSFISGIVIDIVKNKRVKYLFIAFITVNLLFLSKNFYQFTDLPTATFDQKLISTLKQDKDLYRTLPDYSVISSVRRDMGFGAFSMYRIQSTSDYNSMILDRYYRFIDLLNKSPVSSLPYFNVEIPPPSPNSSLIDFLNVKYVLSDKSNDLVEKESNSYKLVLEGERYKLYENKSYLPRFFLAQNAKTYSSEKELEEAIKSQDDDLLKTVLFLKKDLDSFLDLDLSCVDKMSGNIKVVEYSTNRVLLDVENSCSSFLSSSEVYYPGWKARLNGKNTKVFLSNFAFRSIYVPRGKHRVEFYYNPYIFYIGGIISVSAVIILIIIYKKYED